MITTRNLTKRFGGFTAVDDVSIEIRKGSITGLIGPNGAGKTTLFNIIAGALPPTSGDVFLEDAPITGLAPHELFSRGLMRTFQIAHEFASLTVRENLMMVPGSQTGETLWATWFHRRRIAAEERAIGTRADEVMDFLTLSHLADERAGNLSGGQKKLLELGRTMMTDARLVFLDEVAAGVNRTLLKTIAEAILRLNREQNYTFCMIEHDFGLISELCEPVIVLAEGRVLAEGKAAEIRANEQVIEAYLGRNAAGLAPRSPSGGK